MIDPLHSLAFSIQANPGVYAVLIGSGVSRSAQIPTGWEITLDLVSKLAKVEGENCGTDPALWYCQRYGQEPNYSDLLDALAKTPAERQQLLRAYIEPSEEERADGLKAPTAAHRAIASLAAKRDIRVIITTNFDHLMEAALVDEGVVPIVLSSPDQVHGAMPLFHTYCCVFKVHGDYLDTRIRNTSAELESYPKEFVDLLERIFDDFGLIICGWSAEWDTALRTAIERSTSRRFSHVWAAHGELSAAASKLIQHRQAQILQITDADDFFSNLADLVKALHQYARPHPLSTAAEVARLKNYLVDYKHRIRLADLISTETERIVEATSGPAFELQNAITQEVFTQGLKSYDAVCETLIAMAVVGGYWAEDWHYEVWQIAFAKLTTLQKVMNRVTWKKPELYPATLLFYALGLGALAACEHGAVERGLLLLRKLFETPIYQLNEEKTVVELLPPPKIFQLTGNIRDLLEGKESSPLPINDWIYDLLWPHLKSFIPFREHYSRAFDRFEILMSLSYACHQSKSEYRTEYWTVGGRFFYGKEECKRFLNEIRSSLTDQGDQSIYVKFRIFGNTAADCETSLNNFEAWLGR